jgi:hypothetical protein
MNGWGNGPQPQTRKETKVSALVAKLRNLNCSNTFSPIKEIEK